MSNHLKFCLLSLDDAEQLLAFELVNREWFEATIEKRNDEFYNLSFIEKHIGKFLELYKSKQMYPALVKDHQGIILARTNLRLNNDGFNTFGYRVSENASGKGVATFAAKQMINIAKQEFHLPKISAFVSVENTASEKVLTKLGFTKSSLHPNSALVKGNWLDCHEYYLNLL